MKISDSESLRAGLITPVSQPHSTTVTQAYGRGATPAAQVEFSTQAQAIAVASVAVDAAPDIREDLVAKLKTQVDNGTYHVSGQDIADQLLRRAQADRLR